MCIIYAPATRRRTENRGGMRLSTNSATRTRSQLAIQKTLGLHRDDARTKQKKVSSDYILCFVRVSVGVETSFREANKSVLVDLAMSGNCSIGRSLG